MVYTEADTKQFQVLLSTGYNQKFNEALENDLDSTSQEPEPEVASEEETKPKELKGPKPATI